MIFQVEKNERREADRAFAEAHPDRKGRLVRVDKCTLVTIPAGRDKDEYLEQWRKQRRCYEARTNGA